MADTIEQKIVDLSVDILDTLLKDKSTHKHIVWATDNYQQYGEEYSAEKEILPELISGMNSNIIQPRVTKALAAQAARTKQRAEVFTPCWMCNLMNNFCDEEWFGEKDLFNTSNGSTWEATPGLIPFKEDNRWKKYVDSRRLEITCGEAPYIVSRYDTSTGDVIPIAQRIGILDRKLRVVNENTQDVIEWQKWATRAIQAVYGFEYQGDNLIIARINVLMTFAEYMMARWQQAPDKKLMRSIANIISWNFWQMNGYTYMPPYDSINGTAEHELSQQMSMFENTEPWVDNDAPESYPCYLHNWRGDYSFYYKNFKERTGKTMHIDFVIGNPPYQETKQGTSDNPVYHVFMDAAFDVAPKVELITPARFLFGAGKTGKAWNQKMLSDEHFKVLYYEANSAAIFPNTEIKGGIAVTYRDALRKGTPIEIFSKFPEVNGIREKVQKTATSFLSEMVYAPESYRFSATLHEENDWAISRLSKGHAHDITSNIFDKLPELFTEQKKSDSDVQILGRKNNSRVYLYIQRKYIMPHDNLDRYKLFIPKSNGIGEFGEKISEPVIGTPGIGHTQTFISLGSFQTKEEADICKKYLYTKFARCMLSVAKVTQDNKKAAWRFVPAEDFSPTSDIDWNVPVSAIDQQLYHKYNLSDEEIKFIETHVKEMS